MLHMEREAQKTTSRLLNRLLTNIFFRWGRRALKKNQNNGLIMLYFFYFMLTSPQKNGGEADIFFSRPPSPCQATFGYSYSPSLDYFSPLFSLPCESNAVRRHRAARRRVNRGICQKKLPRPLRTPSRSPSAFGMCYVGIPIRRASPPPERSFPTKGFPIVGASLLVSVTS